MLEYIPKFPKIEIKNKVRKSAKRIYTHDIEKPEKLHCRRCGKTTGTEAFRHIETFRKHEIGKGTGIKSNDRVSAFLCGYCDNIMSNQRPDKTDKLAVMEHAELWNWLIIKTWIGEYG